MTVEDAVTALRDHWEDVIARLSPARQRELGALVTQLGGADHATAVGEIAELLAVELPAAHPVRRALSRGYLYATARADWATLRDELAAQAGLGVEPASILAEVTERLLSAPALTEEEVTSGGLDPADPGLLRLDRPDGGRQWPMFQFAPDGRPRPVVRTVNLMLQAESDPLGVADWWLGRNGWLDAPPSELIGIAADEDIIRAARAVNEDV